MQVMNKGDLNADGLLRVGLHYNLYNRLTNGLDFKSSNELDNLPTNLEEMKDNIEFLKGKKDVNNYYSASNLISGRFNDIYGNTLIERRHSDMVFPANKEYTKLSLDLDKDKNIIVKENQIEINNKSLSRIHSYIGWKDNVI